MPRTRLHHLLERSAETHPQGPALTDKDGTVEYAELWRRAQGLAGGLLALGLKRGDRIAVFLDKRVENIVTVFGTSAAGAVVVPVNPVLRPRQVTHILGDCAVRVLVTTPARLASLRGELSSCPELEWVVLVGGTADPGGSWKTLAWPDLLRDDGTGVGMDCGVDSDVAAIFYTSGSTGRPKGVVLSHRNLIVGAESVAQYLGNTADDRILAVLPLSFDAGFSQITTGFAVSAHVVLVNFLLPRDVVRICAQHRITGLTCVPPLWTQLADQEWPAEATGSLRYLANTGGRMPRVLLDRLRNIFPDATPYLMYGLTEAFRSTYLDPAEVDRRPDSIGKAIPNAEILVVRPDGSPCDADEPGELVHRGPLVALGYWNDPERTAVRFRPAPGRPSEIPAIELAVWSGDTVRSDADGFLYFVDRADEMIKTSGYRVSPTEIEEAAYDTGLVGEAVAFGTPDERLGQRIVLFATPRAGVELDAALLERRLRSALPLYMVPSKIEISAALPRSANGKFDRALLRQATTTETGDLVNQPAGSPSDTADPHMWPPSAGEARP